ncbi:MAG: hypothetical protein N4A64_14025 [Marinisporobacter sp.]|jgi:chromosome segregation ATPase|nr:hypothetical protein [Marinisporobacter sp.]
MSTEIMKQLLNEMQSIKNEMSSLRGEVSSLKGQVQSIEENQSLIQSQINNLEKKVDSDHQEVLHRFDKLEDRLIDFEGKNAANHVASNTKLDKISDDIEFLKHEEYETKQDLFRIKRNLKPVK